MRIRLLFVLLGACVALNACGGSHGTQSPTFPGAAYCSWGIDEYELFGMTKQQLVAKYGDRVTFREGATRMCIAPQKGACAGYDGPTFDLTYDAAQRVQQVQRIFMGCKETQWGPVLGSKREALQYFVSGMDKIAKDGTLRPDEATKLKAARAELGSAT